MKETIYIKGNARGSFKLKLDSSSVQLDVFQPEDIHLICEDIVEDSSLGNRISSLPLREEFDRYEVPPVIRKRDLLVDITYGESVYEVLFQDVILHHLKETGTYHDPALGSNVVTFESLFVAKILDWKPPIVESTEDFHANVSANSDITYEPNIRIKEDPGKNITVGVGSSTSTGCFSNGLWSTAVLIFSIMMLAGMGSSAFVGIFILLAIALLMYRIRSFLWMMLKLVFGIALIVWSLALIKDYAERLNQSTTSEEGLSSEDGDSIEDPTILKDEKDGDLLSRIHSWKDYNQNRYKGEFKVSVTDVERSSAKRRTFTPNKGGIELFSELYGTIVMYPESEMGMIQEMYTNLVVKGSMPRAAFAEMVVTSIQNIPYYLVHELDCMQSSASNSVSADFHKQNGSEFCLPNVAFGLTTPSEFVRTFKGDCDTRALYLYNVLGRLGFDVAVLISEQYGHAVLGINLPYEGKKVRANSGKSYTMWETTAPNWKPGQLDPSISDMRLWKIAIQSQP